MTADKVGYVIAAYGVGALGACFIGGSLSDHVGRKPVILLNLFFSSLFTASICLASNYITFLVLTAFIGICAGMGRPASNALIGDLVPSKLAAEAYGLIYWTTNAGFLVGSLIGGVISRYSLRLLFLLDSMTCFVALLVLSVGFRHLHFLHNDQQSEVDENNQYPRHNIYLLVLILVSFFAWLIQTQAYTALPLTVTERGLSSFEWGLLSAMNGATVLVFQPVAIRLMNRIGASKALAIGCLILGLGFGITPIVNVMWQFAAQTIFWSMGEALVATASPVLISAYTSANLRGRWMGYSGAAFSLASIVGPSSGGFALSANGEIVLWSACILLGVIGALFSFGLPIVLDDAK